MARWIAPRTSQTVGVARSKRDDRKKYPKFEPGDGFREKWLPRIVITTGLCLAAAAFYFAGALGGDPETKPQLDLAVDSVFPTDGSIQPRQTTVTIDLATGWELTQLSINGVAIPPSEVSTAGDALGIYTFDPGPGRVIEVFEVGEVRVTVVIVNQVVDDEVRTIGWRFTTT